MKISSSFKTIDSNKSYQSFKGVPPNPKYIPEVLGNLGKLAGDYISMPEQKLFMATTALMLQPLIDLKYAEEDKKIDSAIKSASKSIAGGLTGVSIRAAFIALTDNLIDFKKTNNFKHHFMPDKAVKMLKTDPEIAKLQLKQYNKTLGTLMAMAFMVFFSNSKVDVPLTSDLQDLISGVVKDNKTWLESFCDVKEARTQKIKNWGNKWKNRFGNISGKLKKINTIISDRPQTTETKKKDQNK